MSDITKKFDEFKSKKVDNFNKDKDILRIRNRINKINNKGFFYITNNDKKLRNELIIELNEVIRETIIDIIDDIIKSKPSIIKIEELNIEEMKNYNSTNSEIKNHKFLNKLIDDCHWDLFKKLLEDKCIENNIELILVPQYYPSSKMCSNCGSIKLLSLDNRIFQCEECGLIIDRDENASINIRNYNL